MVYRMTKLICADNSGARIVQCIGILGGSPRIYANTGDRIIVCVKKLKAETKVKKGTIHQALLIRSCKHIKKKNGINILFGNNSVILIKTKIKLWGTRFFGPAAKEIRIQKNWNAFSKFLVRIPILI